MYVQLGCLKTTYNQSLASSADYNDVSSLYSGF